MTTYYSKFSFNLFMPLSILYTTLSHFVFRLFVQGRIRHGISLLPALDSPASTSQKFEGDSIKLAIVTGSNTGIGFETALALVKHGYDVVLACRSREKGEIAAYNINSRISDLIEKEGTPQETNRVAVFGKAFFIHPLDLSDLKSVREFFNAFEQKYNNSHPLDVLVNNAGINTTGQSVDGLDLCFQSNMVGHFLLTRLLLPKLKMSKLHNSGGRIVNLSSVMHHFAPTLPLDDKEWEVISQVGGSDETYTLSKLAAILFTIELNRRFGGKSQHCDSKDGFGTVRAVSVNPGAVKSDIWRSIPRKLYKYLVGPIFHILYLSPLQGAHTSIVAAVSQHIPTNDDALYLQPYWQPHILNSCETFYSCPFPLFEMLGPFIGAAVTKPRLLLTMESSGCDDDSRKSARSLWRVCSKLVGMSE
mmetsp:Transcript_33311/g.38590  ORF Transcript_33311/g.38590 Transcript_33311/m.38590 type:complete len:418 (-) Transcript_33311:25-1278(-)